MNILKTILEITIYSGVIFGITVLFKKFLKNKISPALHLGIWLIFIMRLILPVTFESSVHFFTIQETAIQQQAGIDSMTVQEIDEKQIEPVQQIQVSVNNNLPALNENPIAQNAVKPAANEQDTPVIQSNIPEKQSKSTNFKIDTGSLILTVWVAGIGVFVMYHIYIYCCLLKRVRKNAIRPSNDLHELFEDCKQELGISGNIHLTVQENLHSPALLFPSLILIPVEIICEMNQKQLKLAIMHELTHYKKKDHLFLMLLLMLKIAYWFNPFVWLAERKIRDDIETACDSRVVRYLSLDEKSYYAHTLLSMYKQNTEPALILAMAFGNARKGVETRIRGIYMKRKSNFSIKIMTILIAGTIGISCFTTACQVVKLTAETDTGAGQTGEAEGTDAGSAYYEITELTDYDLDREKNQDILGSVLFDDEIVLVTRESTPMSTEAAMALTDRRADEYADEIIPARYSFMFLDFEGVWKKTIDITNIFESDIGVNSDLQVGKIGGDTIYLIADRYDEENFGKKNIYYVDLSGVCNEKKTLPMQLADEYVRMPFYHSVALDEAGNIYTTESYDEYNRKVSLRVTPFDSTSESFIIEVGDEKSTNNTFDGAMKRIGSGIYVNVDICAANGDFEEAKLCKVDIENKKLGEFLEIDVGQIFNYSPFQNTDNSMIYTDFTGVYQIDEKTMTIQMLLSWSKQDFLVRDNDTSDIVAYLLPNEQILLNRGIFDSTTDPESTMTSFRLYMMKKAQDPNQNKTKLTISGIDILGDTLLEKEIYKYNQTTEDFRIEIKNYDVNLAYAENWRTEIKLCKEEMYADILSGNGPDIILGDAETTSFFMNRELLTDLNGFIEKDTEFQMEEFNPKVMEFGKKDGKQYVLYSSFTIGALVGAKSVIEDRQTWTFEEFDEVTKDFQDSKKVFWNATQASILGNVLASEGGNYYKEGAKIADFTSRRFKDILVFAKKYGMTEDEFSKAVRYVDNYETLFSGGEIALESFAPIYSPLDYLILEDRFAAPITMIGYPSNEGSKVSFSMNKSFAIIENSGHKEEAWEFVKKFFSQENQTQTYTFPTHIETAEALIDEYKNYQAEENILPFLGASHPLSDEGAIVLKELLKSEGQISMLNYDVLTIVTEEAQPYFLDQKSIDQTVEIIQNKVQTYLNEKA